MTGVEILATTEVAVEFGFCWAGFIVLTLTGILFGLLTYFCWDCISASIFIFVFALACAFLVGFNADGAPTEYETNYKVTISDEVSMNDFLSRYEIISQE